MEEKKKNTALLTVVAIATLIVAVIGATFAYFQAQGGATVTRNVRIVTETSDSTSYSISSALTLNINQQNFTPSSGDVSSDPVTGTALFTASTGAAGEMCYTLDINVSSNNFIYTTNWNGTPATHYQSPISGVTGYYDDIESNGTTESNLIAALVTAGKARIDDQTDPQNPVTYIYENAQAGAQEITLTAFYTAASNVKLDAFVNAGYLEEVTVYPTSTDPELVLNVTRATAANQNDSTSITYGSPVAVITNLDVTTLTGRIYIPATATATTVVSGANKGDLGSYIQYGETGGPLNIHKLEATAGKTSAHQYVATLTAKNKAYDQQEITDKTFTGTLTFTTVSCTLGS